MVGVIMNLYLLENWHTNTQIAINVVRKFNLLECNRKNSCISCWSLSTFTKNRSVLIQKLFSWIRQPLLPRKKTVFKYNYAHFSDPYFCYIIHLDNFRHVLLCQKPILCVPLFQFYTSDNMIKDKPFVMLLGSSIETNTG